MNLRLKSDFLKRLQKKSKKEEKGKKFKSSAKKGSFAANQQKRVFSDTGQSKHATDQTALINVTQLTIP